MTTFRSFALTIRPRDGISDDTIAGLSKWLSKLDFAVAVLEKEGIERHLHAQIWTNQPKAKGDIIKQCERICIRTIPDFQNDGAAKKVLRGGIKIAYSDWYLDYLCENDLKEEPNIIIESPPTNTYDYYPTEEEQEAVQRVTNAVDPRFTDLEVKALQFFEKRSLGCNKKNVATFLADAMFVSRTIKVLMHQRDRVSLALSLYAFMAHSCDTGMFINETKEDRKDIVRQKLVENYVNEKLYNNSNQIESDSDDDSQSAFSYN